MKCAACSYVFVLTRKINHMLLTKTMEQGIQGRKRSYKATSLGSWRKKKVHLAFGGVGRSAWQRTNFKGFLYYYYNIIFIIL